VTEADLSDDGKRAWWHPSTVAGAWTKARRKGDAEIRSLTRFVAQAGVGAFLAWRLIVVLDGVLTRQQAGFERVAVAMDNLAVRIENHLDEDVIDAAVLRITGRIEPRAVPEAKPVKGARR